MNKEKDEFVFNEKTHRYYLDGKSMTGCTTILGMIAKPALIGWAANMAVDYIEKAEEITPEVLEKARKAHIMKRDKAAESGTDVHAVIEEMINNVIEQSNGLMLTGKNSNVQVNHFLQWAIKNKVKFLVSEKRVYSKKWFTAGTYDFKCEMGGKTYIGDIKTTKTIFDRTPFAQCAAYQAMEEEMGEKPVDGRLIINLKKTGKFDEDKDVYASYHYEDDLKIFTSALELYRQLKSRFEPLNYQFKIK